jgi:xyloglucan-specific exo-beta-1,4-glucanase
VVWSTSASGVLRSQFQSTFTSVTTLPSGALIASDKRTNTYFYGASASSFYVSKDTGATFTKAGTLGSATAVRDIAAHPTVAGEVWVSTDVGIFRSTNYGSAFTQVSTAVTDTQQIALGLGSGSNWVVYAFGTGSAGNKLYASSDLGATWTDIQGAQGFGAISSCRLAGSANKANQVYVGTNGRSVFYASGVVSGGGSASTTAKTSTTTSSIKPTSTTSTVKTTSTTSSVKTTSTTLSTSTKTSSTPTSKTSTSTAPTTTAVAKHYDQCGGIGFTGPTACVSPYTCQKQNDYYSQCL